MRSIRSVPPTLIPRDCRIGIDGENPAGRQRRGAADTRRRWKASPRRSTGSSRACVAVCLMNSYVNPQHEQRIAEYLAKARPALKVSCSSAFSAEIREYERTSTTVLNAVLIPVIAGYLDKLTHRMEAEGFRAAAAAGAIERRCVRRRDRGAGAGAAAAVGAVGRQRGLRAAEPDAGRRQHGRRRHGRHQLRRLGRAQRRVNVVTQGEMDRMPVRLPMVEIRTIGAGGGSHRQGAAGRATDGRAGKRRLVPGPRLLRSRRQRSRR